MNVPDFLLNWPLYVSDTGRVICDHEECERPEDIDTPGRRVDVAEYLQAIRNHIHMEHSL